MIEGIPDVEWWDEFLLPPNSTEKTFPSEEINDSDIYMERITHFVQHPVPVRNQKIEDINKMVMPVYLTDKEKKKLCRNKRIEKEKDKQEQVKLGLMPAPLPKIKMANYQKIMSKDAITDPSGTELIAKAIINKRQEDHLDRNEERKLTSEGRDQKMLRKHAKDLQTECRQALFRIDVDLSSQP